jgi:diguanylate cyclase (GGDEF)-like protein
MERPVGDDAHALAGDPPAVGHALAGDGTGLAAFGRIHRLVGAASERLPRGDGRVRRRLRRSIALLKVRQWRRRAPTHRDHGLFALAVLAMPLIFAIDFFTGPWSVNILYVAAILSAAVTVGFRWSLLLTVVSVACIAASAYYSGNFEGEFALPYLVELANDSITFALVAYLPSRLRDALDRSDAERLTDPLTRVANRAGFEQVMSDLVALHRRYKRPFGLVFIDVDDFKNINDNPAFGHAVGDAVLTAIGETMTETLRESDVPGRRGGDEFVILLPETDAASALVAIGKLKAALDRRMDMAGWPVSFSIGIASFELNIADPGMIDGLNLFDVADKVQYRAKRGGKNRIEHMVIASRAALAVLEEPVAVSRGGGRVGRGMAAR